jgi:hypothetical protein
VISVGSSPPPQDGIISQNRRQQKEANSGKPCLKTRHGLMVLF